VQTAGDHQVQDEPEVAVHANGDAFADAAECAHGAAFGVGKRGLGSSKEKRAGDSNALDRLTEDAWFECSEVGGDVGEFGHVVQIAGRTCAFARGVLRGRKRIGAQEGWPARLRGTSRAKTESGVGYTLANMGTLGWDGVRFQVGSDQSLLVYFDQDGSAGRTPDKVGTGSARPLQKQITHQSNEKVRKLLRLLAQEPVAGVRNLHPGYCSLMVKFDAVRMGHEELEGILRRYLERLEIVKLPERRLVEVPVCYGGEFGPDLDEVGALHRMSAAQVVEMHASVEYLVYFLGFVPGFAYLGELRRELVTPRLAAPRRKVPAGSVGIAGNQTGVYPFATPGGWRLLGRTPVAMFRAEREELSLLSIGDRVRFVPISAERFAELEKE
jgi:inhibitor of KinA